MHQKNVIFVIISIFKINVWFMNNIFALVCHDLMQKAMNFNNVAVVSVKESDYRINFWFASKGDALRIMKNSNLNEKSGLLYCFFWI